MKGILKTNELINRLLADGIPSPLTSEHTDTSRKCKRRLLLKMRTNSDSKLQKGLTIWVVEKILGVKWPGEKCDVVDGEDDTAEQDLNAFVAESWRFRRVQKH